MKKIQLFTITAKVDFLDDIEVVIMYVFENSRLRCIQRAVLGYSILAPQLMHGFSQTAPTKKKFPLVWKKKRIPTCF